MRGVWLLGFVIACGSSHGTGGSDGPGGNGDGPKGSGDGAIDSPPGSYPRTVFVIPMENEPSAAIYGNTTYAKYINGLFPMAAHATKFQDELPADPSEPHYVWMEAGTNAFSDITFSNDNDPSTSHSTTSTAHLVTQLQTAGISWMSYQEDINAGECPLSTSGVYAPKHDPFVFFKDVIGNPASTSAPLCVAHHKPYSMFEHDITTGPMPQFVFITPNLCHDMHGDLSCPQTGTNADIQAGDTWLSNELPRILAYANAHDGVVFITWDEGDSTNLIPFLALGPRIKQGSTSTLAYTHSSLLKSTEEILGVPVLSKVTSANDFADLFQTGMFP
jgi:hypothetical protein